jgi:hypothetical protein
MNKNHIGVIRESSLHASLKSWYAKPGDRIEEPLDGYLIDLVRDNLLIEIQVGNFSSIKSKLKILLQKYDVRIVHPIAVIKWIKKIDQVSKQTISKRKSPKQGRVEDVFNELIYIPQLVQHPRFSLDVLLIDKEEIRGNDGKGSWRRKGWSIVDHRLLDVIECVSFNKVDDFHGLLPDDLPEQFTTQDLAKTSKLSKSMAQKMVYCLNKMGAIELIGKKRHSFLYQR